MTAIEHSWPAAPADDAVPLRWTAFLFRLPGASGSTRTTLWRMLHDLGALKLGQGTWAIPHSGGRPPDVRRAVDHIHAAGGEVWSRDVGVVEPDDLRLQRRLAETCDHLWDRFFNDADRVARVAATDPSAANAQLSALRESFSRLLMQDLLLGSAARRAEMRLDELSQLVCAGAERARATGAPGMTDAHGDRSEAHGSGRPANHAIGKVSVVELTDGVVRAVMQLTPPVDAEWEAAFNEFERFAYAPDAHRAPLRHNTFTVVTTIDGLEGVRSSTAQRIRRFDAYVSS